MKVRRKFIGTARQRVRTYINGSLVSTSWNTPVDVSSRELLEQSSGHPFSKLSKNGRKPKRPKPYRGKNPDKIASYVKTYDRYIARYARWKEDSSADIGGPFQVRKITPYPALHYLSDRAAINSEAYLEADGTYSTSIAVLSGSLSVNPSSNAQLDAYGTSAIARTLPTNPLANMGQFLVELRDLPRIFNPASWKEKADHFRRIAPKATPRSIAEGASGEFLNVAFGWLPFVNDINDFFNVTSNYQKHINQYARDSGRHIRRSAKLIDTSSTVSSLVNTNLGPYPTPRNIVAGGTLTKDVTTYQRVWFKGSYTYYLPPVDPVTGSYYKRYAAYADKLFGLSLSPDLLWKITPWTWAIDWMTNTGSVIRNWDAFHNKGLVLHYGYVMEQKTIITKWSLDGFRLSSNPLRSLTDFEVQTCKVRRKATPYGFGLNPASFSPFQNGVIAALGINRVARWL
uniref:Maturation n=1 Tax=Leviviridae sp. TaxID=2027243 RepID=A0A514DCA0_9VIRU|nr:MAG: hypothetical protein H2Rhizo31664e9351_000003 [Leviviridae sp.]